MKKSSLFIILTLLILVGVTTATNVKLKQEFTKGNYSNTIAKRQLPPFSYIKEEIVSADGVNYHYPIILFHSDSNYVAVDTAETSMLNFEVKNDTLFITKKEQLNEERPSYNFKATLAVRNVHYLSASKAWFLISNWKADSLSVSAANYSHISFSQVHLNNLIAKAKDEAVIEVSVIDSIPSLHLTLNDKSTFIAQDVAVLKHELHLSDLAKLSLSGKSLAYFGLK